LKALKKKVKERKNWLVLRFLLIELQNLTSPQITFKMYFSSNHLLLKPVELLSMLTPQKIFKGLTVYSQYQSKSYFTH
jgi:hypothetical protein